MPENDNQPREEYANVRPLGKFGPPDVSSVLGVQGTGAAREPDVGEDAQEQKQARRLSRAGFALLLMLAGVAGLTAGIWITFGIGWGLSTLGGMLFAIGGLIALPGGTEDTDSPE